MAIIIKMKQLKNKLEDEEEKNPNPIPIYIVPDTLEQIFLPLPLKTLLKFKIVSKQWRSVIESKSFAERRMKVQKKRTILAVGDHRTESRRFQGDEEGDMEMVYINCDDAAKTKPLLTCDGLVCIHVPGWINVLNPSTGQVLSFPSGPDPGPDPYNCGVFTAPWWNYSPRYWEIGFGRDIVSGSYKIVRNFHPNHCYEILDINIGEWRKLSPPSDRMYSRKKPACVNGCIYWLESNGKGRLLAIDLHTEEFRYVPVPPIRSGNDQVMNLEGRLAIAGPDLWPNNWNLEIRILDTQEKTWTLTYSISLKLIENHRQWNLWFRPVAVSKKGNLYFHDSAKRLFKYYPETDFLRCLSSDICVISPFVENLVSLQCFDSVAKTSGYRFALHSLDHMSGSWISKMFRRIDMRIPNIMLTTGLVTLIYFRYFVIPRRS